jgi:hypothetical protein
MTYDKRPWRNTNVWLRIILRMMQIIKLAAMWNLYLTFCLMIVNNANLGVCMRRYEIFCNSSITNVVAALYSICS